MTTSVSRAGKGPASLIMFAMMFLALGASQFHETARAKAAIDPVLLQLQVTIDQVDQLQRVLSKAGHLTTVRSALAGQRRERD